MVAHVQIKETGDLSPAHSYEKTEQNVEHKEV